METLSSSLIGRLIMARANLSIAEGQLSEAIMDSGEPAEDHDLNIRFDFDGAGNLVQSAIYPRSATWTWPSASSPASSCSAPAAAPWSRTGRGWGP